MTFHLPLICESSEFYYFGDNQPACHPVAIPEWLKRMHSECTEPLGGGDIYYRVIWQARSILQPGRKVDRDTAWKWQPDSAACREQITETKWRVPLCAIILMLSS